ncbi:BRCA1-A complex subunit RAP80 isoform X2 [Hippoglossus stenolepis]|uniref:BRCA1-A complex subunit RAP80 isoform X2 n=1 Tax=Hippoglossus stenolepis TaxID=195615 RepID=UPI001FAF2814|nr:BRCA1-A complex subunit RAP80 isoform X2 [Hippoglossus stenolepis]
MRGGRGGHSSSSSLLSSSVSQEQNRMSVRKQIVQEATNVPTEIIIDDNTQELESGDDREGKDELSSSLLSPPSARNSRRRERETQSQPKEMTEEEMMDLALRLSEQEASNTALQLQREEEAMMKAIEESKQNRLRGSRFFNRHGPGSKRPLPSEPPLNMVGQTQPCPPSQSQSLLAHASLRLCSRRKLLCSNGMRTPSIDQGASKDVCTPEIDLTQETKGAGDEIKNRNKKRKRKEGIPLETSDVSQKIDSQASPGSSQPLDSPQIDDSLLCKSPVFLSTDCRALVHVPRLSQDLLETCRSSGFVLCSQDTCASPRTSLPALPKSPTFPRSPGNLTSCPKSPVSLQGDDEETQLTQSLEYLRSPVFGRNSQRETTPSACKPLVSVCKNSGLEFSSSQESLTSSVRTTSCRAQSPVFPRSPAPPPPPERSPICGSPVFSETHRGAAEPSHGPSSSPVFGRSGREVSDDEPKTSVVPSEVERSNREVSRAAGEESSQRPTQPCNPDPHQDDVRSNMITVSSLSDSQELVETPEDLNAAETELTSDMTLVWSDKDEDVTPAGSPSPVFPEERAAGRAEVQVSSLNHDSAASPGAERRSSSAERQLQPVSSGGAGAPPAAGPTVQYYWGVPFCPRGLDPDAYTQVILAQMDVYDKSLKQAQRRLLRKAPWGDAVLPQPERSPSPESSAESPQRLVPRRRGIRLRKKNQSQESPPAEAEEEGAEQREGEEEEEAAKQKREGGEEGQMDTDDCDVCPETQLSNNDDDETQDMMIDAGAEPRPERPDLPEVQMIPRDDPPAAVEPPPPQEGKEEMEVDAAVCGPKEGNVPVGGADAGRPHKKGEEEKEDGVDPDVEETKVRGLQRPKSPEVEPGAAPPSPEACVDCPICQGSFPVTKIEWHAAYCDGEVAVLDEREPGVSSKPRRKRRRAEVAEAEETNDSVSSSRNQEKCFICQKKFSLREYNRHTELCLQRRTLKSETRGNLLSALEQTENRGSEAGPSGTRIQPEEVIDLRDDDDEEEDGVRALSISNSPIRSFTPISEATGCLIDFRRQQRAKKPSHRRR